LTEGIVKVGERLASVCNDSLKLGLQDTYRLGVLRGNVPFATCVKNTRVEVFSSLHFDHCRLDISQNIFNNDFLFVSLSQATSKLFLLKYWLCHSYLRLSLHYPKHSSTSTFNRGIHD
jgi:hypothetical protein